MVHIYHTDEEKKPLEPMDLLPILFEATNCSGTEKRLSDCDYNFTSAYSCFHEEDVILTCLGVSIVLMLCSCAVCKSTWLIHTTGEDNLFDCEDGEVKVVGGRNNEEGLLKICRQKVWGSVCNYNWNSAIDSAVACRQLGFLRSGNCMLPSVRFAWQDMHIFFFHSSTAIQGG